ncbi:Hemolysins and related proteins containing CBS domains, partial [hydrothermal vent metagenome]
TVNTVWIVIFLSLLLSAFFSGMEIAFVSSSRLKQELDLKKGLLPAKILSSFYTHPSKFIGALLLGNNISLVIYGIAMVQVLNPVILHWLPATMQSEFYLLLFQTILATLLILIVSEFIPKILFRINPNTILKTFAIPVWLFYYLFYPVIFLYIGISEWIIRLFLRVDVSVDKYTFSAIDLNEYVQELHKEKQEDEPFVQEIQMMQNAIEFKNIKLRDCMIPRTEIVASDINEKIQDLRKLFTETGHSKIMIYEDSIDNLLGYVHAYDMFKYPVNIREVMRPAEIFPETMAASEVLSLFIKKHKSVAIVVDEFGGTSGMVTMEDIIEEIFGEIEDEYDTDEVIEKQLSDTEFVFSARIEIDYLNEKYNFALPESEEYETIAGFILHHHESIPLINEEIEIPPYTFKILKASGNRLEEIRMMIKK